MTLDILSELESVPCALEGVRHVRLPAYSDSRGTLAVLSRPIWPESVNMQWNLSTSEANVLRGLHVHLVHSDWLCVVSGSLFVGLLDLRPDSCSRGHQVTMDLKVSNGQPEALYIPPGVAHGFFNRLPHVHLYGTSTEWSPSDEFGCRYDDPAIGIEWPIDAETKPLLSERDSTAGSLANLLSKVDR